MLCLPVGRIDHHVAENFGLTRDPRTLGYLQTNAQNLLESFNRRKIVRAFEDLHAALRANAVAVARAGDRQPGAQEVVH